MNSHILRKLFFISLAIITINFVLMPLVSSVSAATDEKAKYVTSGDEKFDRIYREARDLHDKEQWPQAIEKFKEIVCDCPEKKYVDAAFYWLAHSYKKLKMFKEATESLNRLMKNFPDSSWTDDARVMIYELRSAGGQNTYTVTTANAVTPGFPLTGQTVAGVVNGNLWETSAYTFSAQPQLDREDEIKLAAFQSLLAGDPKRGIEIISNILKTDSKASETLKREVIRSLSNPRPIKTPYSGSYWVYETSLALIGKQDIPMLRDTLLRGLQNELNIKIRTEIIYALINLNDEQTVNYLTQLYTTENNREIKKALINSFGRAGNLHYLMSGYYAPSAAITTNGNAELLRERATELKAKAESTVTAKAQGGNSEKTSPGNAFRKIYFEKLMEITRTEKDPELRRLAFSNLQKFSGWSTNDGIVEMLSQIYESESDEQFKSSIIRAFAGMKQSQATGKLLEIAKNDKSDKMRLEAIWAMRGSKNPEIIKFLEDLIK